MGGRKGRIKKEIKKGSLFFRKRINKKDRFLEALSQGPSFFGKKCRKGNKETTR